MDTPNTFAKSSPDLEVNQICVSTVSKVDGNTITQEKNLLQRDIPIFPIEIRGCTSSNEFFFPDSKKCSNEPVPEKKSRFKDTDTTNEKQNYWRAYDSLSDPFKKSIQLYLESLKAELSDTTIDMHQRSCSKFLSIVEMKGCHQITSITASLVASIFDDLDYYNILHNSHVVSHVSSMLRFFYERGEVTYGCTIILHYLTHGKIRRCFWNEISPDAHKKIQELMASLKTESTEILHNYKNHLALVHTNNGYSAMVISTNNRAVDLLILFLEMNNYKYSPEIAMTWLDEVRPFFGGQINSYRRALRLIEEYHRNAEVPLSIVCRENLSKFYHIPEWCQEAAFNYVKEKRLEGWQQSTINMICSSITRFCEFLSGEGIHSFRELNSEHIRRFNFQDIHKTPQGKSAYNSRIRKFLIYLADNNYLSNPMLFAALSCSSAPKETIVVVLTEEEMSELNNQLKNDSSKLSLRKKAMLLLGIKMGLRASDIANLSIEDIDWDSASIKFVQKKTSVEVNLPMPVEVGNALFRYITEERGKGASGKIFLSEKAPHKPVSGQVCKAALRTALPNRKVEGSGFHVMRKTYATNLIKKGVGVNMIVDALGQRGKSSVHHYLSLDSDRMRMCPLSLAEFEIGGWNDEN